MSTNFPTVINPADLTNALAHSQVQETQAGGVNFLKMDFDTGEWLLGQEGDLVTEDEILVNTVTIQHGWILWSGGRPNKNLVPFTTALPQPMEPIGEDHPSEARAFQAGMIDDGESIAFDTNSYGGRKGVDVLLGLIKAHAAEGSKFLYPKVKLMSENYPGTGKRSGKTNYNPVFELVAWCDEDGNEEGKPATQVETQPGAQPETPAEPRAEATEEQVAEAPKKRQRRKKREA